jgi:hypothetical protein
VTLSHCCRGDETTSRAFAHICVSRAVCVQLSLSSECSYAMAEETSSSSSAPKTLLRALSETSLKLLMVQMALPEGYKMLRRKLRKTFLPPEQQTEQPDPDEILVNLVKWASGLEPLEFACRAIANLLTGAMVSRYAVVPGVVNLVSLWLAFHLGRGRPNDDDKPAVVNHWARFEEGICLLVLASGRQEAALDSQLTEACSIAMAHGAKEAARILVMSGATPYDRGVDEVDAPGDRQQLIAEWLALSVARTSLLAKNLRQVAANCRHIGGLATTAAERDSAAEAAGAAERDSAAEAAGAGKREPSGGGGGGEKSRHLDAHRVFERCR